MTGRLPLPRLLMAGPLKKLFFLFPASQTHYLKISFLQGEQDQRHRAQHLPLQAKPDQGRPPRQQAVRSQPQQPSRL